MNLLKEYNLMENKKVIFWLNVVAIPLFFLFTALFTFIISIYFKINDFGYTFSSDNQNSFFPFILFFFIFFIIIIIHELIHGLFFKLFNPESKVRFGFKNGMAYATSPHTYYPKNRFIIICLAPFVFITAGLLLLLLLGLITEFSFVFYASIHASSCIGDFYWVFLLSRFKGNILVEDTEKGMTVYLKDWVDLPFCNLSRLIHNLSIGALLNYLKTSSAYCDFQFSQF